ncbi:hypothetical protein, partial [Oribacterium sinus]|uniref:hypothetical protein n=1 Tax=Oribacterium sinus TaxID=237576 RepID=UPI0026EA0897
VIPSTFKAIFPSRLDSLCTLPSLNRTAPVASLMTILPSNDFLSFLEYAGREKQRTKLHFG